MYTIIKIPFDKCIVEKERRGAALGPNQIEKELKDFFLFESLSKNIRFIEVTEKDDFEKLHKETSNIVETEKPIISLGGDHSTSYGIMKGFSKAHKNSCLLFFDAHFDCQDDFLPPTHEDILRAAVKEGFFKPEDIFVVGARNYTEKELSFIKDHNIKFQFAADFSPKEITQFASKYENIYFNLDIDVIDPAFAPGTGWPEPLGLNPNDILSIILQLNAKIKLLDIVEISPPKDVNNTTSRLTAKILLDFLANRAKRVIV